MPRHHQVFQNLSLFGTKQDSGVLCSLANRVPSQELDGLSSRHPCGLGAHASLSPGPVVELLKHRIVELEGAYEAMESNPLRIAGNYRKASLTEGCPAAS